MIEPSAVYRCFYKHPHPHPHSHPSPKKPNQTLYLFYWLLIGDGPCKHRTKENKKSTVFKKS